MAKDKKEKEQEDIALIYLQTFATPGGLEVLSDLMKLFYGSSGYDGTPEAVLANAYRRDVVQYIIQRMQSANKMAAAEVVFKADCI